MNKLTKVGCSALCGSLAAISAANAGDLTVTGGADMTWVSKAAQTTGNPIGIGSNMTFNGGGELENGWTFDMDIALANGGAYSSTVINLDMGGLGKLNFNSGDSGNGIQAYDDKMPTAWEEPWGAGLSTGIRTVDGVGSSMNVQYTTPKILGVTAIVAMAHDVGTTDTADKATAQTDSAVLKGYDGIININPSLGTEILSGLNLYVGAHYTDNADNAAVEENLYEAVGGVTYDLGPISLGAMWAGEYTGQNDATAQYNFYKAHGFGIAFNINDNLSVSYGEHQNYKAGYTVDVAQDGAPGDRRVLVDSVQVAYTMGGASIRVADINADNVDFSAGNNQTATVVSMGLAF